MHINPKSEFLAMTSSNRYRTRAMPSRTASRLASLTLLGAAAFLGRPVISTAQPVQWASASGGNNHQYEAVYVQEGLSWIAARDAAALNGGYLASVTSADENTFIYGLVLDTKFWPQNVQGFFQGPWLGGFQPTALQEPVGGWAWVSGEAWTYTNWASSGSHNPQPDNWLGIENYLGMLSYGQPAPYWNDYQLDPRENAMCGPVTGFIVEYDSPTEVPEPSSALLLLGSGMMLVALRRRTAV